MQHMIWCNVPDKLPLQYVLGKFNKQTCMAHFQHVREFIMPLQYNYRVEPRKRKGQE